MARRACVGGKQAQQQRCCTSALQRDCKQQRPGAMLLLPLL
jgi:hypothetical protein